MSLPRWASILAAALAGMAALLFVTRAPTPAPDAAAPPVAAPLELPASAPGSAVAATAPPVPADATAARPAAPARPRIGSEGYGTHIERAQAGNDAAAAWESVQWLRQCATNEGRRHSFETLRNQGVSPDMMTELMVEADAEARRCQTITAQHRALLPELALRAMRGGVPEAASAYAAATRPGELAPALRQEVTDAMRRDAQAGHPGSLLGAIVAAAGWGLSEAEQLGFLYAYGVMTGAHGQAVIENLVKHHGVLRAPPTPEQLAAAKRAGQQIIDRASAQP